MLNSLISLDELTFENLVKEEKELIIINFSAEWCGPCKMMHSILTSISQEEEVKIFRVNVDESPNLTYEFGIENIPVTLFLKSGKKIHQLNGLKSKEELKEKLYELK